MKQLSAEELAELKSRAEWATEGSRLRRIAFEAAASPTTVLALIEEVEQLRRALSRGRPAGEGSDERQDVQGLRG